MEFGGGTVSHVIGVTVLGSEGRGGISAVICGGINIRLTWGPWEVCVERRGIIHGVEAQIHVVGS